MQEDRKQSLVSIIVPVYNVDQYLGRSVESMLNQNYGNIEIILVDDGSKDRSGEIADEYAKTYERVISIRQNNQGVSVARNIGMDIAKGEYITFVDPDDYLELDAIEVMVSLLEEHGVDIVRTRCQAYRNDRKISNDYSVEKGLFEGDSLKNLAYRSALHYAPEAIDSCCWLLLVRKSLIDEFDIRFSEGIVIMQDTWFYVDLLRVAGSLYSDDSITYNYMINDNGTVSSKSRFVEKIDSIVKLYEYVSSVWSDDESSRQLKSQYYALLAIRTVNSSSLKLREIKTLLSTVSQYEYLFKDVDVHELSLRLKIYIYSVRHNSALLVASLAFIRKIAIFVKG